MTDRRTDPSTQDLNPALLIGAAVLFALGSVAGLAGLAMAGAALISAGRHWYHRVDLGPQDLARLKWEQTKAAAGAGKGAWRDKEHASYAPRSG